MSTHSPSSLTGCIQCGVIFIDGNICQNCFTYLTPEQVWEIYQSLTTHGGHMYATIKNCILQPPSSLDLQVSLIEAKIACGATCQKCGEFFPYATAAENFRCWACKNIWT